MRIALSVVVGALLAGVASFGVYAASQPAAQQSNAPIVQYAPSGNN